MPERDEGNGPGRHAPRTRAASFFRAIVAAAVAAAAPVAGCYQSEPGDDTVSDADADADDGRDGRDDGYYGDVYGLPLDGDESTARYAVPMYGTP